jgi:hypothetical protein
MAKDMNIIWLIAGGVLIYLAISNGWLANIFGGQNAVTPPSGGGITPPAGNGACPATLGTSFQGDFINSLDLSAASYGAMPFRLVPDGNYAQYTAYTAAAVATRTTAVTLKCDHPYQIIVVPAVDTFNPLPPIDLGTISGVSVEKAVQGTNFSLLTVQGYDNTNRAFFWSGVDTAIGQYDPVVATLYSSAGNATAYAIGVGGTLDLSISVKTVTNMEQFGNSNLGVYIAVDADKSSYDTPLLQLDGVTLSDVKNSGELSSDDLAALSSYEYIFKVPAGTQLQATPKILRYYVAAKAGVNPSADMVLRFLAKSNYVGMDGTSIHTDLFNRASASEVISATASTVTLDMS